MCRLTIDIYGRRIVNITVPVCQSMGFLIANISAYETIQSLQIFRISQKILAPVPHFPLEQSVYTVITHKGDLLRVQVSMSSMWSSRRSEFNCGGM